MTTNGPPEFGTHELESPEWLKEHKDIPVKAQATLSRLSLARELPGGETVLSQGAETLERLYGQTVDLRRQNTLQGIDAARLQSQLDASLKTESTLSKNAVSKLPGIVQGLDLEGKNSYIGHYKMRDGTLVPYVEFEQIDKARKEMDAIPANLLRANPRLNTVLSSMRKDLAKVEETDSVRGSFYKYNQVWDAMRGATDYRPMLALAGVGGALITALGIGISVNDNIKSLKEGGDIVLPSVATGFWAFVTYAAATRGGMFRSTSSQAQEQIAALGIPQVKELTSMKFFKGPKGAENFLALQDEVKGNIELRKFLRSGKPITHESLKLYIKPETELGKQLASISQDKLALALSVFGERMPERKKELYAELLRTYDQFRV